MVGLHSAVPGVVYGGGGDLVGYLAPRMTVSSTRLTRLMARQRKTLSSSSCCTIAHTKVNRNSRLCTSTAWSAQLPAACHTSSPYEHILFAQYLEMAPKSLKLGWFSAKIFTNRF